MKKLSPFLKSLLIPISLLYGLIVYIRNLLFDFNILSITEFKIPIISVGNITVGGTGKTPVVEVFAKTLSQKGRKVAILSRGYRSKERSFATKMKQRFSSKRNQIPFFAYLV